MYRDPRNSHQFSCPNDLCLDVGPTHNLTDVRGSLRVRHETYIFSISTCMVLITIVPHSWDKVNGQNRRTQNL